VSPETALTNGRAFRVEPPAPPRAPTIAPRLVDSATAASYLGCSRRQLRAFAERGWLRRAYFDRRVKYSVIELDRLVERALAGDLPPSKTTKRPGGEPAPAADPSAAPGPAPAPSPGGHPKRRTGLKVPRGGGAPVLPRLVP
jgi:hypothetical protein